MKEETFIFYDKENVGLFVYKWTADEPVRGIVQIAHGMAETASRYRLFAEKLTQQGFIVYAHDHRGHGNTAGEQKNTGYCGEDGFNKMAENLYDLNQFIRQEHPHLPLFLFGHSMGSFLVQKYITVYPTEQLAGIIMSGSNGKTSLLLLAAAGFLAKMRMRKLGSLHKDTLLHNLMFRGFNKKCSPSKTGFDWLTRDEQVVQSYINDPYCGFTASTGFFYDFFHALKTLHHHKSLAGIRKDLPIYIFSGEEDPVGNYGKGIKNLVALYEQEGLTDVTYTLYAGGRHEMLNEINKDEVVEDVLAWLQKKVNF